MTFRKIKVHDQDWEWYVGRQNVVLKRTDFQKKNVVSFADITGLDQATVERGIYKRWLSITPQMVSDYIYFNYISKGQS